MSATPPHKRAPDVPVLQTGPTPLPVISVVAPTPMAVPVNNNREPSDSFSASSDGPTDSKTAPTSERSKPAAEASPADSKREKSRDAERNKGKGKAKDKGKEKERKKDKEKPRGKSKAKEKEKEREKEKEKERHIGDKDKHKQGIRERRNSLGSTLSSKSNLSSSTTSELPPAVLDEINRWKEETESTYSQLTELKAMFGVDTTGIRPRVSDPPVPLAPLSVAIPSTPPSNQFFYPSPQTTPLSRDGPHPLELVEEMVEEVVNMLQEEGTSMRRWLDSDRSAVDPTARHVAALTEVLQWALRFVDNAQSGRIAPAPVVAASPVMRSAPPPAAAPPPLSAAALASNGGSSSRSKDKEKEREGREKEKEKEKSRAKTSSDSADDLSSSSSYTSSSERRRKAKDKGKGKKKDKRKDKDKDKQSKSEDDSASTKDRRHKQEVDEEADKILRSGKGVFNILIRGKRVEAGILKLKRDKVKIVLCKGNTVRPGGTVNLYNEKYPAPDDKVNRLKVMFHPTNNHLILLDFGVSKKIILQCENILDRDVIHRVLGIFMRHGRVPSEESSLKPR